MSVVRKFTKSSLGAGVAGIVVLGATIAATGTAEAASDWGVQVVNSSVGGGSFQVSSPNGAFPSTCYTLTSGSAVTTLRGRLQASQGIALRGYRDSNCQGSSTGTATYSFRVDQDRSENGGRNCGIIRLWVSPGRTAWINCS